MDTVYNVYFLHAKNFTSDSSTLADVVIPGIVNNALHHLTGISVVAFDSVQQTANKVLADVNPQDTAAMGTALRKAYPDNPVIKYQMQILANIKNASSPSDLQLLNRQVVEATSVALENVDGGELFKRQVEVAAAIADASYEHWTTKINLWNDNPSAEDVGGTVAADCAGAIIGAIVGSGAPGVGTAGGAIGGAALASAAKIIVDLGK